MKSIFLVMVVVFICSCSSTPYSKVDGGHGEHIDRNNDNVIIAGVDGKQFVVDKQILKLEPGIHELRVYSIRPDFRGRINSKTFSLDAKPCIKYFLAAHYESEVNFKEWKVIILREEPISHCENLPQKNDG